MISTLRSQTAAVSAKSLLDIQHLSGWQWLCFGLPSVTLQPEYKLHHLRSLLFRLCTHIRRLYTNIIIVLLAVQGIATLMSVCLCVCVKKANEQSYDRTAPDDVGMHSLIQRHYYYCVYVRRCTGACLCLSSGRMEELYCNLMSLSSRQPLSATQILYLFPPSHQRRARFPEKLVGWGCLENIVFLLFFPQKQSSTGGHSTPPVL